MTTFADFLADMPGVDAYAREIYLLIDAEALRIGEKMAATYDLDDLRSRSGSPWLQSRCQEIANALSVDVRLAAMPVIEEWCRGGYGRCWSRWYETLLRAHIKHEQSHQREAAE
jgi:hypothetical protein